MKLTVILNLDIIGAPDTLGWFFGGVSRFILIFFLLFRDQFGLQFTNFN